jgi:hypothetical protein
MRNYLIAALCLLAVTSCRRLADGSGPGTNEAPRLVAIYDIDTMGASQHDTLMRQYVSYDGLGRVSAFDSYTFGTQGDTLSSQTLHIEYSGGDTMAARSIIETRIYSGSPDKRYDTVYYRFQNGRLLSDSVRLRAESGQVAMRVRRRSYSGDRVTETSMSAFEQSGTADTTYATRRVWLNRVGPYLLSQLDSTEQQSIPGGTSYWSFEATMAPTVVPNPLYAVLKSVTDDVQDGDDFTSLFYSLWTPRYMMEQISTTFSSWYPGGAGLFRSGSTTRYQVTTRSDSYPVRVRQVRTSGTGTEVHDYHYIYQ